MKHNVNRKSKIHTYKDPIDSRKKQNTGYKIIHKSDDK